jgi:hypothetical protein
MHEIPFPCRYAVQLLTPAHFIARINGMLNILWFSIVISRVYTSSSGLACFMFRWLTFSASSLNEPKKNCPSSD